MKRTSALTTQSWRDCCPGPAHEVMIHSWTHLVRLVSIPLSLTVCLAAGVIVFGSDQEVAGVMAAVGRLRATDAFGWVGSDGWSARALVSEGNEAAVEGTISVQPQANQVRGFREYFLNLTVENNPRNPWFVGNLFYSNLSKHLLFASSQLCSCLIKQN